MKVHSDIIIFELLKLYFEATDETKINITFLEKGFYTLLNIIREKNNIELNLSFENELRNFLINFSEYFILNGNELEITDEIIIVFNAIIDSHEKITIIDGELQEDVHNQKVYKALNLSFSHDDIKEFFDLNKELIRLYLKLGENELHNYFDQTIFEKLKECISELNEKINDASSNTLTKLKICFNYYNDELLANTDETHINSVWNTILFSNNPKRLYSLAYDRIEYLTSLIDPETDDESEELLNNFFDTENNEENIEEKLSDISYFLTIVLIELNNYLNTHPNTLCKEALLIKKYLLISTPELSHIEKYFLANNTLATYPEPPIPDDLDTSSFENLKNKVIECTTSLVKNNKALTKPYILANTISSAIFIKAFLDISINPDSIQDIIDLIENSVYYKQPNYETITTIIDEIIFTDSPNLQR